MIEQIEIVRAHFMMQPLCAIMTYNKIKIPQPDSTGIFSVFSRVFPCFVTFKIRPRGAGPHGAAKRMRHRCLCPIQIVKEPRHATTACRTDTRSVYLNTNVGTKSTPLFGNQGEEKRGRKRSEQF